PAEQQQTGDKLEDEDQDAECNEECCHEAQAFTVRPASGCQCVCAGNQQRQDCCGHGFHGGLLPSNTFCFCICTGCAKAMVMAGKYMQLTETTDKTNPMACMECRG